MKRGLIVFGVILAGLVVVILAMSQKNPYSGRVLPVEMTPEDESALGTHMAPWMSQQLGGLDPDTDAQGMVTAAGDRIAGAAVAGGSTYRFQFHVLADTALAEAYALPGGHIFLTRGLLERLENEAQLAGVLAHQVAHVLARHTVKPFTRADTTAGAVRRVLDRTYGVEEETEADTLSVRLLGNAGYDPRALIELLRVAEEATRLGGGRGFSLRHPFPEDRRKLLNEAIARTYAQGIPSTLTLGRWFAPEPPESPDHADEMEEHDPADSAAAVD
ncbi:MAG TPA: M48 family metalloprotease [Candidatus Eisenbacteria bacterium]|nr:M48 family metalloprotease [Candidatus Eisenbacteria bacterium]